MRRRKSSIKEDALLNRDVVEGHVSTAAEEELLAESQGKESEEKEETVYELPLILFSITQDRFPRTSRSREEHRKSTYESIINLFSSPLLSIARHGRLFRGLSETSLFLVNPPLPSTHPTIHIQQHVDETQACRLLRSSGRIHGSVCAVCGRTSSSAHRSSDPPVSNGWKCNFSQNSWYRDFGSIRQEDKGTLAISDVKQMLMDRL